MYGRNACVELRRAIRDKPFQGQDPRSALAKVIFLGLDANYSNHLDSKPDFLEVLLRYHHNGVQFWENDPANRSHKHHPFLIDSFPFDKRKDGYRYHRRFDEIGFTPANTYAKHISFLELLAVPTTNDAKPEDKTTYEALLRTSGNHLAEYVQSSVTSHTPKVIFISSDVINRFNQAIGLEIIEDEILPNPPIVNNIPVRIRTTNRVEIYKCYHLSIQKNKRDILEHFMEIKMIADRIIAI